jgi:hypothetical protein
VFIRGYNSPQTAFFYNAKISRVLLLRPFADLGVAESKAGQFGYLLYIFLKIYLSVRIAIKYHNNRRREIRH